MPGTQQNTAVIGVGRQVTLFEAGIVALLANLALYLVLPALGLLGFFLDELPGPIERPEINFTFAPEVEMPATEEAAAPGSVPGTPLPADAVAEIPEPAAPVPQTTPPSPPIVLSAPPLAAVPPLPLENSPDPAEEEPSSEGVDDIVEEAVAESVDDVVPTDAQPDDELFEADSEEAEADVLEAAAESFVPETAGGALSAYREAAARAPAPSPGRPEGPSLDQRISDFGRAVQRARESSTVSEPQQPRNSFEPDWASLPTTGQAIGNMTFESGDYDWEDYQRQIYFIIWRAWHNRLLARVDDFERWAQQDSVYMLDHVNGVRFTIERSGEIVDIVLERESGSEPFDLSSIEGLDEALLPPLPDDFPRDSERVFVYFLGQGPIGGMRRSLQQYKRAGWF